MLAGKMDDSEERERKHHQEWFAKDEKKRKRLELRNRVSFWLAVAAFVVSLLALFWFR